jgi:hypothetical protein
MIPFERELYIEMLAAKVKGDNDNLGKMVDF